MPHDPSPDPSSRAPFAGFERALGRAAGSAATVLLRGESGSGKTRAARRLHAASARSTGPFVCVSLAALSPTLIEAELFGHEAGAFTGARRERAGRFRQADGGTLVLEDVDALPLETQAKLLRVVQERVVEPLGSEESIPVDVRIVVTTTVDLAREVAAGRFRSDLYYRLAVLELVVPPLRERIAELGALAGEILGRSAPRLGVGERALSSGALARLRAHAWPGNVRELENGLERVLVLGGEGPIDAAELAFLDRSADGVANDLARRALAHGLELRELERALLAVALEEAQGNVSAAARRVGLTRRAFEYRWSRSAAPPGEPAES